MRNFVKSLVTNRFGIVLAALNVCYFVSRKFVPFAFSHGNQDSCAFYHHNIFPGCICTVPKYFWK